jgi:hypothetical protein
MDIGRIEPMDSIAPKLQYPHLELIDLAAIPGSNQKYKVNSIPTLSIYKYVLSMVPFE